jgi:hypothetical protein
MVNVGIDYTFMNIATRVDIGWNPDFLLASMYQKGGATVVAGDYCTGQHIALVLLLPILREMPLLDSQEPKNVLSKLHQPLLWVLQQ